MSDNSGVNILTSMIGKTIVSIEGMAKESNEILVVTSDDQWHRFYHEQECCEQVYVADVTGDIGDLIGHPLLMAEVVTSEDNSDERLWMDWTFYKFATIKGYVTIRWLGVTGETGIHYSTEVKYETCPLFE